MDGFKITILPMLGILLGMATRKLNIHLDSISFVVFFLIIFSWLLEKSQGLDGLVAGGWE